MKKPTVSVLMPAYNVEKFIAGAVDSILNQTFRDFELIIVNDGSADRTSDILAGYRDPRVKILTQQNSGLKFSLNRAIHAASGKYVARMDSDDISLPRRIELQVKFLEEHLDVVFVGTTFATISSEGILQKIIPVLEDDAELRSELLYKSPFAHGSIMVRREILEQFGETPYSADAGSTEDYYLWTKIAATGKLANLAEPLFLYRDNPTSNTVRQGNEIIEVDTARIGKEFQVSNLETSFKLMASISNIQSRYQAESYELNGQTLACDRRIPLKRLYAQLTRLSLARGKIFYALRFGYIAYYLKFVTRS